MKFFSLFFLLGLLASALGGASLSRKDVHLDTTVVTVSESTNPNGVEQVFIEIDRIEDDLNDDGVLLAERDIRVALQFEVQEKQVLVNGVVAPFGLSELSVQAQIYEVVNAEHIPFGEIVSVSIRVHVSEGTVVLNNGVSVSTLVVQERVIGIQQAEVWQAEVVQQIFVVQEDGTAVRFETTKVSVMTGEPSDLLPPPPPASGSFPGGKPPGHHGNGHHGNGHHGKPHHKPGSHGKPPGYSGPEGQENGQENGVEEHRHHQHQEGEEPEYYPGMGMVGEEGEEGEEGEGRGEEENRPKHGCYISRKIRKYFNQAAMWFHGLAAPLQVLVAFGGGIVLGLIGVLIVKIFFALCCCASRKKSAEKEDYKQNIKVYSLQYSAVPQEDEEKKEKKENAIQMV